MARGTYRSGPDFKHYHVKNVRDKRRARLFIVIEIIVVIAAAFVFSFFFCHYTKASGDAMSPTIEEGDTVLLNRLTYRIGGAKRGSVAAFYLNGDRDGTLYLRRVVGIPGDTVLIEDGVLYVNGEETELASDDEIDVAGLAGEEITLGENEYFVIGDSPDESNDSRHANIGTVTQDEIFGTVWAVLFPINHAGLIT